MSSLGFRGGNENDDSGWLVFRGQPDTDALREGKVVLETELAAMDGGDRVEDVVRYRSSLTE